MKYLDTDKYSFIYIYTLEIIKKKKNSTKIINLSYKMWMCLLNEGNLLNRD